jgi:hypothetical protein
MLRRIINSVSFAAPANGCGPVLVDYQYGHIENRAR